MGLVRTAHVNAGPSIRRSYTGIARRVLVVAAIVTAVSLTPAKAAERGIGVATGSMACGYDGSSLTLASDHLAYGDTLRAVGATVVAHDDCRVSGMLAIGAAHVTGDGITCGQDLAKPFTGYFVMATPGFQVQGGMWGTCVVDGIERASRYAFNGVVVDGRFVGYLMPTGDAP